uniref:caspase family protein n=1 Tax=Bradyrhizobium sp. (strain ORS 278) TaxID=114615 RepID=UPI0002E8721C|nr:caspase family protein [Bradyrhizobium sp. ORS 278]
MIRQLTAMVATIVGTLFLAVLAPDRALAERRVALVIGNSSYQSVPQLANPARDANSIAKMFRDAGFETVDTLINVGNLEFKRAIRKFEATADQADIVVVYYAGHGLEIGGLNYLIPVDARLASDRDADDEAIPLERLVSSADGAKRLRLVILDACRDNPFVSTMRRERRSTTTRAVGGGLGKVEPTLTDTLIAYAAKAGSTADDGDGEHSPFTLSILKNLTVPGLDVRLAFGRVRDEVLRSTGNRQEPYVYGALGGGTISLVPAPAIPQEAPVSDVKADYELVQKISTKRAWEVFLATHPTGFYADLARAQLDAMNSQPQANIQVAAIPPASPETRDAPPTKDRIEWDKIKDSVDIPVLQRFIKRFPDAPLAITAQQRIDVLKRAIEEREEAARAAREAARQAVEDAKRKAEAEQAQLAAQKKREEDERRARIAEAAEQAKAAAAAAAAEKKRIDDERRAAAAEADRLAKAAEAERKAQLARQQAEQAERDRAAAAAAAAKAAADKQAKEAEEARRVADLAAAKEAACKDQQAQLDVIIAKGSAGSGIDDLKSFSKAVTCERLGPLIIAAVDRFNAEAAKRAAAQPNSPQLVTAAQIELIRLGCLTAKPDGKLTDSTKAALNRYLALGGQPFEADKVSVTQDLVGELGKHATRVCPIQCKSDETLKGDVCVATEKPVSAAPTSRKEDDEDKPRRKQANREAGREPARRARSDIDTPRARQQAVARPSIVSGGGAHSTIIGVGF